MLHSAGKVGPNVSADSQHFFQSDADIAFQNKKSLKKKDFEKAGQPIATSSKVLGLLLTRDKSVYVAESGFIAKKIHLEVCFL